MKLQLSSGILLVAGFVCVLIASVTVTARIFQEKDPAVRLDIIAENKKQWMVSNTFWALAAVVTGVGFLLLSLHYRETISGWLLALAAGAYLIGVLAWVIFAYRRVVDPAPAFENYQFTPLTWLLLGGTVIGLLLYGVIFMQVGYPGWLGISLIGMSALIGGAALLFPARFYMNFPPQVLYLLTLVAGIVIWQR